MCVCVCECNQAGLLVAVTIPVVIAGISKLRTAKASRSESRELV